MTYPEINVQISTPSKFSVAHLERDRHLVILVQRLMKALAGVCSHLDVVRIADGEEGDEGEEEPEYRGHDGCWCRLGRRYGQSGVGLYLLRIAKRGCSGELRVL